VRFALDTGGVLARRAVLDAGAVYGVAGGAPAHDARMPPLLTVAWLEEPAGVTLDEVVAEDLARQLSDRGAVLLDSEDTRVAGVDAVRTFVVRRGPGGRPTASEQWRLLAGGRRWTVTALTALPDQPVWGPRLAGIAAGLDVA
jgi:hypothetical protein